MAEGGLGRGDAMVTGESQVEASTHAVAFNGGNDGGGMAGDCAHQRLAHGGEFVGRGAS